MKSFSVAVGGMAGDGINEAGLLIARILSRLGYRIYIYYDYPSLIRGGHNFSLVRASDEKIGVHTDGVDVLLALNQDSVNLHKDRLKESSVVIYDSNKVKADGMGISIGKIMKELGAPPIMHNTCIIGAFCKAAGIKWDVLEEVVKKHIDRETDLNLKVAREGYDAIEEAFVLDQIDQDPQPVLTGNEAVALGLVKGGLEAYVAYPMTPSSGVLHLLSGQAERFGIKVVHPENEIAVMLMALGFSYAGKRSAVGTSGGGFCLMTEGLSLAGQAEIPVTVVVSQRSGPSTGVPTYTAQADLDFVLNAGHGEFPRLVVAPGNAEEAYYWSALAMNLSWKYQVPSFVLVDKTLSEGFYSFDLDSVKDVERMQSPLWQDAGEGEGEVEVEGPYRRYLQTESGVSPLAWPPQKGGVVKVTSYSHDEDGVTAEDAGPVASMKEKARRKSESLADEMEGYATVKVYGRLDSPSALICWGSNRGVCMEVAEMYNMRVVQPLVLSPFPRDRVAMALNGVERVLSVECNVTGQLARLFRYNGFVVEDAVLKYDARPFSIEDLDRRLEEVMA